MYYAIDTASRAFAQVDTANTSAIYEQQREGHTNGIAHGEYNWNHRLVLKKHL
jgi:hypothetical protein